MERPNWALLAPFLNPAAAPSHVHAAVTAACSSLAARMSSPGGTLSPNSTLSRKLSTSGVRTIAALAAARGSGGPGAVRVGSGGSSRSSIISISSQLQTGEPAAVVASVTSTGSGGAGSKLPAQEDGHEPAATSTGALEAGERIAQATPPPSQVSPLHGQTGVQGGAVARGAANIATCAPAATPNAPSAMEMQMQADTLALSNYLRGFESTCDSPHPTRPPCAQCAVCSPSSKMHAPANAPSYPVSRHPPHLPPNASLHTSPRGRPHAAPPGATRSSGNCAAQGDYHGDGRPAIASTPAEPTQQIHLPRASNAKACGVGSAPRTPPDGGLRQCSAALAAASKVGGGAFSHASAAGMSMFMSTKAGQAGPGWAVGKHVPAAHTLQGPFSSMKPPPARIAELTQQPTHGVKLVSQSLAKPHKGVAMPVGWRADRFPQNMRF